MRGAETIDRYRALPEQEAFDIEYWQLEEAKLKGACLLSNLLLAKLPWSSGPGVELARVSPYLRRRSSHR